MINREFLAMSISVWRQKEILTLLDENGTAMALLDIVCATVLILTERIIKTPKTNSMEITRIVQPVKQFYGKRRTRHDEASCWQISIGKERPLFSMTTPEAQCRQPDMTDWRMRMSMY